MPKVAIVTGGGRGIGPALVRGLERILAGDTARGAGGIIHEIPDVRRRIEGLAAAVAARHRGVDIVISNPSARILPDVRNQDQVREFVEINNHGAHRVIKAFAPLLNDGARFVVVADRYGALRHLPAHLRTLFEVERMSLDDLAKVMDDYVDAVETGRAAAAGWPGWLNVPSRIGQVAAVKVLGRELAEEARRRDIVINAACPDAGAAPERAAADVLRLATLPAGTRTPYAELVYGSEVIPFQA